MLANRSGLTNSDNWMSGNLAQSKSVKLVAKKEREYEENEKESRSGIQSQGGKAIAAIKGDKTLAELAEQLMCIRIRFLNGGGLQNL